MHIDWRGRRIVDLRWIWGYNTRSVVCWPATGVKLKFLPPSISSPTAPSRTAAAPSTLSHCATALQVLFSCSYCCYSKRKPPFPFSPQCTWSCQPWESREGRHFSNLECQTIFNVTQICPDSCKFEQRVEEADVSLRTTLTQVVGSGKSCWVAGASGICFASWWLS